MTAEEFEALPSDDELWELISGQRVRQDFHDVRRGSVTAMLTWLVGEWVLPRRLGAAYAAGTGYVVERRPDSLRPADFSFIRRERLSQIIDPEKALRIPPDIAAEVLSPSDRPGATAVKAAQWLTFGVGQLWVVDPAARTLTVHRPGAEPVTLPEAAELDGGSALPGFRLRIGQLFE